MPISFNCGQCGKPYVVSDGLAGKKAMCKQCSNRMTIPGDAVAEVPAAAPVSRPASPRPAAASVSQPKPVPTAGLSFDDVYGMNEPPSGLPPAMPRAGSDADSGVESPVKKKKKKKGFVSSGGAQSASSNSGGVLSGIRVLGIIIAIVVGGLGAFRGMGLTSKSDLMQFNERQLAHVNQLTAALKGVKDMPSAQTASGTCNTILNAMIADLEINGRKKARVSDINEAKAAILPRIMQAKGEFETEVRRLSMIPGAVPALNILTAITRLETLERELTAQNAGLGIQ